ncbi:MAG: tetratricopeptide (TPR) repeat protein [Crocinitomicaceae bacterium]|jgi:tetratricopeptide (TPR) repeat protein
MRKRILLTFFFWINIFFIFPCGWDSDTIAMEKRMFPTVHELITGKFLQHSQAFYYWRVNDRTEKIQRYPDSLSLYDDLAWALNKIGEPDKGVEIMLQKEKKSPGLYKTYANLGTCYIHANQFEKGLKYIKKAIKINPEAHFGREIYQQHLVEYVISKKDNVGNFNLPLGTKNNNFYHYLKKNHFKGSTQTEIAKAVKGIGGMMKFSDHNSPILLEALGDLLSHADNGVDPGAGHLSSRAYLKAALLSKEESRIEAYKKKARLEIERQFAGHHMGILGSEEDGKPDFAYGVISIKDLETVLKLEIQAANVLVEEIRQNELSWIKEGVNPDSAFTATYYDEPISIDISMYNARNNIDQVQENYWLSQQLKNINDIDKMYTILELPDSTKNWIDSIYKLEFSILPDEPINEDSENKPPKKTDDKSYIWISLIGLAVLISLILIAWKINANRKKSR